MKIKLLTLLFVCFIAITCDAQWIADTINFESSANSLIKIDTSQHPNIWQIGTPHKVLFDSALTHPNAIVTDTVGYYPINNTSSFQFTIYDSVWILSNHNGGWQNNEATEVGFYYKMNTDSLKDGGYIEYSLDTGTTWSNISSFTPFYNYDTITGGIPAFSGDTYGWRYRNFIMFWCNGFAGTNTPHSVILRFTFKSDSINTNKEGWMIDNINYNTLACEGIKEYTQSNIVSVSPNPATDKLNITIKDNAFQSATITITNIIGETIQQLTTNNQQLTINIGELSNGMYFVESNVDGKRSVVKVVKEKD